MFTQQISEFFKYLNQNLHITFQAIAAIGLVIVYWLIYIGVNKFSSKTYSPKIINIINNTSLIICIFLTIFTLFTAFQNNLSIFLSSISFLSAALVFALQDFVSSFISWIYIQTSDQYSVGDSILIISDTRTIYGTVKDIGVFRTTLIEKLGDNGLDTEMNTGRIITFPNRFVYKHSLTNYTKNHLLIQHKFVVTVELDQDHKKAKNLIQQAVEEVFIVLEDDETKFLDPDLPEGTVYTPKVYMHLDEMGYAFTIWFACKIGTKRPVLEYYTEAILDRLAENKIKLAYPTYRLVQ